MLEDHQAARTGAQAHVPAQQPVTGSWPPGYPAGYAVVDVETTGLARDDRVVSAAVYQLDAHGEVQDHWYTAVNPQRDPGPTWIHGLTAEMLADAPLFPEIVEEFSRRLAGRVLVAHNAVFDWTMIAREYARAKHTAPVEQRLCTISLSKALALPLKNHKLETLAAFFGVAQRRAHHALDDARVLAEVFRPSLHRAAGQQLRLPLLACRPLAAFTDVPLPGEERDRSWRAGWRQGRRLPPSPFPNPGRFEPGGRLVQGMRVAFSGDTSVERELLEDRAAGAGLHVAPGVSRMTSLLVTNDPHAATAKVTKARAYGTPIVDEADFLRLLGDVAPAPAAEG
ncbi:DEDDh family exonuclease [Streptomyces sp. 4N509B]|uniref:DEDDh family exonuclease n=1 Tax=Streptomyces sp. 4N509B TaxID=3457413 RepID=UPI003FD3B46C